MSSSSSSFLSKGFCTDSFSYSIGFLSILDSSKASVLEVETSTLLSGTSTLGILVDAGLVSTFFVLGTSSHSSSFGFSGSTTGKVEGTIGSFVGFSSFTTLGAFSSEAFGLKALPNAILDFSSFIKTESAFASSLFISYLMVASEGLTLGKSA
jgi:hypothetical protein